jgi:hypothetical protein
VYHAPPGYGGGAAPRVFAVPYGVAAAAAWGYGGGHHVGRMVLDYGDDEEL